MERLFCSILLEKARATDTVTNVYYDFLYAYNIKRGMPYMRQAAIIMYEQATKLQQFNTVVALEKQVRCYLTAINALSLSTSLDWIQKPNDPDRPTETICLAEISNSGESFLEIEFKGFIELVTVDDLRNEYEFAWAKLQLARYHKKVLTDHSTSEFLIKCLKIEGNFCFLAQNELIVFLSKAGLYKAVLNLCSAYNLEYDLVFESLTRRCVKLMSYENQKAWNWLIQNDLHGNEILALVK